MVEKPVVRTIGVVDDAESYRRLKGDCRVAVCVPCRNESPNVGELSRAIVEHLLGPGLVDEFVVLDDGSTDDSAALAAAAGAKVVSIADVNALHGPGQGKGNVLWASLTVTDSDVVVWCDADVTSFRPEWVLALAAPLLADDSLALVKGFYERPTADGGGGRTTELVARPLLSMYFPELSGLRQPLAGEYAIRRSVAVSIPFVQGWGVEIAMAIDVSELWSADAIGQVDLGRRRHRRRTLADLAVQGAEVMATALSRTPAGKELREGEPKLVTVDGEEVVLNLAERPPLGQTPHCR